MTELDSRYSSTSTMSHRDLLAYYGYLRPAWLSGELARAINAGLRIVGSDYPLAADDLAVLLARRDRISLHHPELEEAVRVLVAELSRESSQPNAETPAASLHRRDEDESVPPPLYPLHEAGDPWTRPIMGNVSARLTSSATPQMITWVSCHDPVGGINRRCTWVGETRRIVVTGLPARFASEALRSFELPPGARVHEVPSDANGFDLARHLDGVLFTLLVPRTDPVPIETSNNQPDVRSDLREALSAAIDALGKVMLEMQRRRLIADPKSNRRTRKILVNDPKKLTDEQIGALATDAFEAGALMLASIGHPGTGVFSCNSIDGDAP